MNGSHPVFSRPRRLAIIAALLAGSQLVACGGGGGHDGDGDGGSGGGTPPPPATAKLRFRGAVTDAPIAHAAVTITIGAQRFTTTADANGVYDTEVEIDENATGGFVTIDAKGSADQAFVEFKSLAASFATLAAQAGSDGTLTPDENFATQVTNVSTAEAALLQQANGGQPVTSETQKQSLGAQLNGQQVLDLATAIKLAVDSAAAYPLPAGFTSTLALASDPAASSSFVAAAQSADPATFSQTQAAIAGDPALTKPIDASAMPASLTAAILSTDAGFTFNYSNRVNDYVFNSDGSGTLAAGSFNTAMEWTVSGTTVQIAYAQPVETTSFDFVDCDGEILQAEGHYVSSGATLALISDRTLTSSETYTLTYPDCSNQSTNTRTTTTATTILNDDDFEHLTPADVADSVQTFYVYDTTQHTVLADVAQINADGSGTALVSGVTFNWSLDEVGAINVSFANGITGRYRPLREIDQFTADLFYRLDTGDGRFVDAGAQIEVDPAYATTIDVSTLPGRYYQFGVGNEQDPQPGVKGFRLRFDPGGGGAQEDDFLDDNGNVTSIDETTNPGSAFRWTLEDNNIVVRRSYDGLTGATDCLAGGGSPACVVYDERTIVPLVDNDNRYYVLELRRLDVDGLSAATPHTALVRYYDYEPLGAASAERSGAATSAAARQRPNAPGAATRH
jgi:hypothetical protein